MKERFTRKKLAAWLGILVILGLLLGVIVLAAIIYVVADAMKAAGWDVWYMQYLEYIILIALGIFIVRYWMTEYEYDVIDDELIIDRYIGKRPRNLLSVKLGAIVSVETKRPDIKKMDRLTFKSKRSDVKYMVYKQNGQQKCLYFSPSDDLLALIEQRRHNR
jgi:hypothetical protein